MKPRKHETHVKHPARPRVNHPSSFQTRQLAGYLSGSVGLAAVLGASQAEAAIVYWDPADVVAVTTEGGVLLGFDMVAGTAGLGLGPDTTGFSVLNYAAGDVRMFPTNSQSYGLVGYSYNLYRLSSGTSIGSGSTFANGESDFDWGGAAYQWNTDSDGTTGYVGLSFDLVDGTHYGWARFTYDDATTGDLTLHDFAYESEAGVSILAGAGAVPEPGSALLALAGLGGLALRRRRRQVA